MKFILTIWVCSFLGGQVCMPPIQSPIMYDSWYECSRAAHHESVKIIMKVELQLKEKLNSPVSKKNI